MKWILPIYSITKNFVPWLNDNILPEAFAGQQRVEYVKSHTQRERQK
jgi:hypothetical protein